MSEAPAARRAGLIFNPAAGRARAGRALPALERDLGHHFDLTVFTTSPEHDAEECARRALASKPELLIAAGGDGTVSMVARALVGTPIPLGVLPCGTANSIAGGLGIPLEPAHALEALREGATRRVDTARANGRTMLLHASIGFHAATVKNTPRDAKSSWGMLAYVKEALSELIKLEPFSVEIETERAVVRCRATNVTVANVAPARALLAHGPAVVAPDDGALDVTIVTATSLAEAVATGLHLLRAATLGEPATGDNIGFFSARRLRIDTEPPQPLLVDGENAGRGAMVIECVPSSLSVVVPPLNG